MKMIVCCIFAMTSLSLIAKESSVHQFINMRLDATTGELVKLKESNDKGESLCSNTKVTEYLNVYEQKKVIDLCKLPQTKASSTKLYFSTILATQIAKIENSKLAIKKLEPMMALAEDVKGNLRLQSNSENCREEVASYLTLSVSPLDMRKKEKFRVLCETPTQNLPAIIMLLTAYLSQNRVDEKIIVDQKRAPKGADEESGASTAPRQITVHQK